MAKDPKNIADASGFAFQMAVEHAVQSTAGHNFSVVAKEHAWHDELTGRDGFIDLVLESGAVTWAVECKRTKDASWVFLVDAAKKAPVADVRCLFVQADPDGKRAAGWFDVKTRPESPESAFCAVHGSGEGQTPMLERIATGLIRSTDALADEDIGLERTMRHGSWGIYIPAIVTTANLQVGYADASQISLADGLLPQDTIFDEVPMVRFRKTFSTEMPPNPKSGDLGEVSIQKERTVMVINSRHFVDTLTKLKMYREGTWGKWPWVSEGLVSG